MALTTLGNNLKSQLSIKLHTMHIVHIDEFVTHSYSKLQGELTVDKLDSEMRISRVSTYTTESRIAYMYTYIHVFKICTYTYMYIHIRMYMYICVYIYIHIYINMYIGVVLFTRAWNSGAQIYIQICIRRYTYTYIYKHIRMYTYIHLSIYIYIYIYIYKCMYIQIYLYIYT